jgi:hypothetical protein
MLHHIGMRGSGWMAVTAAQVANVAVTASQFMLLAAANLAVCVQLGGRIRR